VSAEDSTEGLGLEARLTGVLGLVEDERSREQSFNTRAIAIGTAALAVLALAAPVMSAVSGPRFSGAGHRALGAGCVLVVAAAAAAVVAAIALVLMPKARQGIGEETLDQWLEDEGMSHTAIEAQYELVAGMGETVKSRRTVNERKATGLTTAYYAFLAEIGLLIPVLATEVFS
jgi:hypothetical protein